MATLTKYAGKALAASMFFCLAALLPAQQGAFDGNWQMDTAKSHVTDGRVVSIQIATAADGAMKMTIKTQKKDGQEVTSEFLTKFDGKASEFLEGNHKSQVLTWYNGPTLNVSKENGPPTDVTSMWKFEMSPDKQTLTMTMNHYDPAAADETLVFTKKAT